MSLKKIPISQDLRLHPKNVYLSVLISHNSAQFHFFSSLYGFKYSMAPDHMNFLVLPSPITMLDLFFINHHFWINCGMSFLFERNLTGSEEPHLKIQLPVD